MAPGLQNRVDMAMRGDHNRGFTLVELLVVIAILGILAAIAIPQFATRQGKAYDARVAEDVRNAALGQEAYFLDHLSYSSDCETLPGFRKSDGVLFSVCEGDANSYRITADHPAASKQCTWDPLADPILDCVPKS